MTSFPTTGPIAASVDLSWGDITVVADAEGTTDVEVTATDASNEKDRKAAEDTTVTCTDGRLRVVGPKNRTGVFNKKYGSVQVAVRLPRGSDLEATAGMGAIAVEGGLGSCRAKTSAGDIRLQDAESADLRTALGGVIARDIAGEMHCSTGAGSVDIERIGGRGEVKNSNGDTRIGENGGPLRVKSANGNVAIGRSRSDVHATTANGDLLIASAHSGSVQLKTSLGRIEVGIAPRTAARLDLSTSFGTVRNELDASDEPAATERTVEIHAQTSAGDIDVLRAADDES